MRTVEFETTGTEVAGLEAMHFDLKPADRLTDDGPEQGAPDFRDHRSQPVQPSAVGDGCLKRCVGAGEPSEASKTRGSRRTPIRHLAIGVASDVRRPEALISRTAQAGSDFADVVPLGGGRMALILGDVCGRDRVPTRRVPETLSALRLILGEHAHPAHALGALNRALCGADMAAFCRPVLLSLAVVDVGTGESVCACAGSEPPLILRVGGSIEAVNAGVRGLGVDAEWTYRTVDFLLREGDALLLATDGVTGARRMGSGEEGESLGCDGLAGLALDAFRAGGPPRQAARAVLAGAKAFAGGVLHDDASILVAIMQ